MSLNAASRPFQGIPNLEFVLTKMYDASQSVSIGSIIRARLLLFESFESYLKKRYKYSENP
jgi:hypothetical protein